jgi:hypothetical protein
MPLHRRIVITELPELQSTRGFVRSVRARSKSYPDPFHLGSEGMRRTTPASEVSSGDHGNGGQFGKQTLTASLPKYPFLYPEENFKTSTTRQRVAANSWHVHSCAISSQFSPFQISLTTKASSRRRTLSPPIVERLDAPIWRRVISRRGQIAILSSDVKMRSRRGMSDYQQRNGTGPGAWSFGPAGPSVFPGESNEQT